MKITQKNQQIGFKKFLTYLEIGMLEPKNMNDSGSCTK